MAIVYKHFCVENRARFLDILHKKRNSVTQNYPILPNRSAENGPRPRSGALARQISRAELLPILYIIHAFLYTNSYKLTLAYI